jgi:hypothetical protein
VECSAQRIGCSGGLAVNVLTRPVRRVNTARFHVHESPSFLNTREVPVYEAPMNGDVLPREIRRGLPVSLIRRIQSSVS